MKGKKQWKQTLAYIICAAMLCGGFLLPGDMSRVSATESSCGHHTHDENCGYDETGTCAYECQVCKVQEMIDALPAAEEITAENAEKVAEQLAAIDQTKLALSEEELDSLNVEKYMEAAGALAILDNQGEGADKPKTVEEESTAVARLLDSKGALVEEYDTPDAAFKAAKTGYTVVLLKDYDKAVTCTTKSDGYKVTFDLNGHTITCSSGGVAAFRVYGKASHITIIDSSESQTGGITASGTLPDKALRIDNNNASITVKGGTYTGAYATYVDSGTIYLEDGTFNGELEIKAGTGTKVLVISGGTFSEEPDEAYLADGITMKENADGTYKAASAIAVIEGDVPQYFYSLKDAVKAANEMENAKITLLDNIELTEDDVNYSDAASWYLPVEKSMTIDLGGYTVKASQESHTQGLFNLEKDGVKLTLQNGSLAGDRVLVRATAGEVVLSDVDISSGHSSSPVQAPGSSVITIDKDSSVTSTKTTAVTVRSTAILHVYGTINTERSEESNSVFVYGINAGGTATVNVYEGAIVKVTGLDDKMNYAIYAPVTSSASPSVNVSGGTLISSGTAKQDITGSKNVIVSGGSFTNPVPVEQCAEGYTPTVKGADGTYSVELLTEENGAVKVVFEDDSVQYFADLESALAKANENGAEAVVTLLKDVSLAADAQAGENVTLYIADGRKLTVEDGVTLINKGLIDVYGELETAGEIENQEDGEIRCHIKSVSLDKSELSMTVGDTGTLKVAVQPENAYEIRDIVWSSSNPSVVTVDSNGVLTAVGAGEARITVTIGDYESTCIVKVKAAPQNEPGNSGNNTSDKNTGSGSSDGKNTSVSTVKGVQTGDSANILLWAALAVLALAGAVVVLKVKRR